jgi:hypothetical protein
VHAVRAQNENVPQDQKAPPALRQVIQVSLLNSTEEEAH